MPGEIADIVLYQFGALGAIAKAEGVKLRHVKPHGALYNMSVRRADVAEAIATAVASFDDSLLLIGLPDSQLLAAGARLGLRVAAEGFADRSYEPDGTLTPRQLAGAVLLRARTRCRSRCPDGARWTDRRARRLDAVGEGRHDLRARRYARLGCTCGGGARGAGGGGGYCCTIEDWHQSPKPRA